MKRFCVSSSRILSILFLSLWMGSCLQTRQDVLYLYNWTYYTPTSLIKKFEQQYNVQVVYDDYASNEDMFAKLSIGASGYDLVVPSGDFVSIMKRKHLLEKIDLSKIPNVQFIKESVRARIAYDPKMEYSVPYYLGAAGIAVNKKAVPSYARTWSIFSRKDLAYRMSMMDDMREVMGAALASLGYNVNTKNEQELAQAAILVTDHWKPNLVKFDSDGYAKSFASGDFVVAHGFAEAFFAETPEAMHEHIDFFIPQDVASPVYVDSFCIPKGARNRDLAHAFINFFLEPAHYAEFLDTFGFPSTIHREAAAYQKKTPYYSEHDLERGTLKTDVGAAIEHYNAHWNAVRFR